MVNNFISPKRSVLRFDVTICDWNGRVTKERTRQPTGTWDIWQIGADRYVYDKASRLLSGTVVKAPGSGQKEEYTYDAAGNILSLRRDGGALINYQIDDNTNRFEGNNDVVHDASGHMLEIGPYVGGHPRFEMEYDAHGMQTRFISRQTSAEADYRYLYGPGDRRLVTFDTTTGERVFKLRGLGDEVLREYSVTNWGAAGGGNPGEGWVHVKDFLYGPEGVFATRNRTGSELRFLHKDHLGTTRALTDHIGDLIGQHDFYPFGLEAPRAGQADEPTKKYTGHERDPHGLADYMLGRTYLYPFMRFATPDPARDGWSLYAYTGNNPVNYVDPDGHESRADVMLNQDVEDYLNGDITAEQYWERINARGQGALLGLTLVSPVDEATVAGALIGAGVKALGRTKVVGKIGGFFKKLFGRTDDATGKVDEVAEVLDTSVDAAGAGSCFPAGTAVWTDQGLLPIEEVESGHRVACADTQTGKWSFCSVEERLERDYAGLIIAITVGGEVVHATSEHPFWVVDGAKLENRPLATDAGSDARLIDEHGRWIAAEDLLAGDTLLLADGRNVSVEAVDDLSASMRVFNLHVAELHNFAVGEGGLLVHNMCALRRKPGKLGQFKSTDALRRENGQVDDVVKQLGLSKDQRDMLHQDIGGEGLTYKQIFETAEAMFGGQ